LTLVGGYPSINASRPGRWKADIAESVDLYNAWFMQFAPKTYRDTRVATTNKVELALRQTADLTDIGPHVLRRYPSILPILRMATAPPIARDRLIGLSGVSRGLVHNMEIKRRVSSSMGLAALNADLKRIEQTIVKLIDRDVFPWLGHKKKPGKVEVRRAATIVADRLCGDETRDFCISVEYPRAATRPLRSDQHPGGRCRQAVGVKTERLPRTDRSEVGG